MDKLILGVAVVFPVLIALIFLAIRSKLSRGIIASLSFLIFAAFSGILFFNTPFVSYVSEINGISISSVITVCDLLLLAFILFVSIKHKKVLPAVLTLLQLIPVAYFEFVTKPKETFKTVTFLNDHLSLVMMLLILIIGPLIAVFAVRYMEDFEHHQHIEKSRQPFFFFIIFLFLGSMSGLVLSNNLLYMYFFWEMTTLCSFLLISFSKTKEAIDNAFRALWMNLIGGVAFISAIILFYNRLGTFSIDQILSQGRAVGVVALPLALLAIAGFTKAAQFPFQSWLLGAMVAPTPVSALLHSSTMVKAGVYLLVRFSPAFMGTRLGYAIAIVGSFTFVAASALAIGQSNAKRVLAYSTIANLGLIVATAGIGTPLAITAAILLIIFHAVSKGLLFLCVGTIEHGIGSRDIEDMDGLIGKMPLVGILTVIGMFSMLLPPFGVIITKLLGIEAAVNSPVVLLFIVMGSAFTVMFWTKWMGKVLTTSSVKQERLENYSLLTVIPLSLLAIGVIFVSVAILQINNYIVAPYIGANWMYSSPVALNGMLLVPIFIAILCVIALIPIFIYKTKPTTYRKAYMGGENTDIEDEYTGPGEAKTSLTMGNFYLEQFFKEDQITITANIFALAFISFMFGVIL